MANSSSFFQDTNSVQAATPNTPQTSGNTGGSSLFQDTNPTPVALATVTGQLAQDVASAAASADASQASASASATSASQSQSSAAAADNSASAASTSAANAQMWAQGWTVGSVSVSAGAASASISGTAGNMKLNFVFPGTTYTLPASASGAIGGVMASSAPANQFSTGFNTSGVEQFAQPDFSNLSGTIAASQLCAPSTSTLGGVFAAAGGVNQFQTGISTSGAPTFTRPSFSNLGGTIAASQYLAATSSSLGAVVIGSNITVSSGTISLTSGNVTAALGFTPYNATNPSGYIAGINSTMVTNALGFTPYNASNPNGYITGSGYAFPKRSDGANIVLNWSGLGGSPSWVWGGADGVNMYVYSPANFSVNYANSAGSLSNIGASVAGIGCWNVGSYINGYYGGNIAPGALVAGSSITVYNCMNGTSRTVGGTWMYMGSGSSSGSYVNQLFQRTS